MMRIAIIAEEENKLIEFANFCFKSYWEDDLNVGDEGILEKILIDCDMDPSKIFELIESDKIKNKLRNNTENLLREGGSDRLLSLSMILICILEMIGLSLLTIS